MAVSVFKKENYFEIIVDSQEVVKIEWADPLYPPPHFHQWFHLRPL